MERPDFTYTKCTLFTTIYPNTAGAHRELSKYMATNGGSNKILTIQFPQFRADATAAGYTFARERRATMSAKTEDALLADLS